MGDGNRITDHSEVQKGEEHLAGEDFDEAFDCDEDKGTKTHSKKKLVVALGHQIESRYGHESVRNARDATESFRGKHRVSADADEKAANGAADA